VREGDTLEVEVQEIDGQGKISLKPVGEEWEVPAGTEDTSGGNGGGDRRERSGGGGRERSGGDRERGGGGGDRERGKRFRDREPRS
jgi:polyribonucleotide nucleotidyltransferase